MSSPAYKAKSQFESGKLSKLRKAHQENYSVSPHRKSPGSEFARTRPSREHRLLNNDGEDSSCDDDYEASDDDFAHERALTAINTNKQPVSPRSVDSDSESDSTSPSHNQSNNNNKGGSKSQNPSKGKDPKSQVSPSAGPSLHRRQLSEDERIVTVSNLKAVPLFSNLTDAQLDKVAGSMKLKEYKDGQVIIQQGSKGEGFYVLKAGSAAVSRRDPKSKKKKEIQLDYLSQSDYFGEAALLNNAVRSATVTAVGHVVALFLHRKKFKSLFLQGKHSGGLGVHFAKRKGISQGRGTEEQVANVACFHPGMEKSDKIRAMLVDAVSDNVLFTGMTKQHILKIVSKMWRIKVKKGDVVMKQGESGDNLYVVEKGKLNVYIQTADGKTQKKVDVKKRGQPFGDVALMYDTPRTATVVAATKCALWCVDRFTFRSVLTNASSSLLVKYEEFLKGVKLLGPLSTLERSKVAEALEVVEYADGDVICRQGDEGNDLYIISQGKCKVTKQYDGPETYVINTLSQADAFGERALVKQEPRSATVTAMGAVEVVKLGRSAFTLLLGPLEELLSDRVEGYQAHDRDVEQHPEHAEVQKQRRGDGGRKRSSVSRSATGQLQTNTQDQFALEDLEVLGTLGNGSFGTVELVKHAPTGGTFALKIMNKSHVVQTQQQAHVLNEKEILVVLAQDPHPNLVRLMATFKDADRLYFLMEAALGGELFTTLRVRKILDHKQARFYAAAVVSAFGHMHSRHIVYRDLKPENVLLDSQGYLKIADFGFAKYIPQGRTWTLCGTPHYLAPEIIHGKGHGLGVDWWCLGVLIFEMLAGHTPFTADEPMALYTKIVAGKYTTPPSFSKEAAHLCYSLLKVRPTSRLGVDKRGWQGVRAHPWFSGFDWEAQHSRSLRAPIIPFVDNEEDMDNFARRRAKRHNEGNYVSNGDMWDADF